MQLTPQDAPHFFWLLNMNMKILSNYSLSKVQNNFKYTWLLLLFIVEMEHRCTLWMLMEALHFIWLLEVKTTSNQCLLSQLLCD